MARREMILCSLIAEIDIAFWRLGPRLVLHLVARIFYVKADAGVQASKHAFIFLGSESDSVIFTVHSQVPLFCVAGAFHFYDT